MTMVIGCWGSGHSVLSQSPTPGGAEGPEFTAATVEYTAQEKAVDAEIEPKLSALKDRYRAALTALSDKLNQSKRAEEADRVKAELKRFDEHGLDSEPDKKAPAEIRSLWGAYVRDAATVSQSVILKRNTARAKFAQALTALELGYRKNGDAGGLAGVKRARAAVAIRNAIDNTRYADTELAGKGKTPWQDIVREGGYVIGFTASSGGWFQFKVLGSLTPIFATAEGRKDGIHRGNNDSKTVVVAKDGFAVGGLIVRSGEVVNCVQIIFMRINLDGVSLNPQDFYVSDWLGGEGGSKPKEINARGHMAVGVFGSSGSEVDSIGLVALK